jgi:Glycosyl transferases group 1.
MSIKPVSHIAVSKTSKKVGNEYTITKKTLSNYILSVSTIEPRKNYPFLIESFAKFKCEYKWNGSLIIAGKTGWGKVDLIKTIEQNRLNINRDIFYLAQCLTKNYTLYTKTL